MYLAHRTPHFSLENNHLKFGHFEVKACEIGTFL